MRSARVSPDFFVTARYEAWPELWMTLSDQEIPLLVVGCAGAKLIEVGETRLRLAGNRASQDSVLYRGARGYCGA